MRVVVVLRISSSTRNLGHKRAAGPLCVFIIKKYLLSEGGWREAILVTGNTRTVLAVCKNIKFIRNFVEK